MNTCSNCKNWQIIPSKISDRGNSQCMADEGFKSCSLEKTQEGIARYYSASYTCRKFVSGC